jgi:hypothetical protein
MQVACLRLPVIADLAAQARVIESKNPQELLSLFLQAGLARLAG